LPIILKTSIHCQQKLQALVKWCDKKLMDISSNNNNNFYKVSWACYNIIVVLTIILLREGFLFIRFLTGCVFIHHILWMRSSNHTVTWAGLASIRIPILGAKVVWYMSHWEVLSSILRAWGAWKTTTQMMYWSPGDINHQQ
jgi:hypothetical protein